MITYNSGREMFMKAHAELMQEWKVDHPNADMEEAYTATRFAVYERYRDNYLALYDDAYDKAEELIDHFKFH